MKPAQKKLLNGAIELLDTIGAKYAIVFEEEKFGELEVVIKPKRKLNRNRWNHISAEIEEKLKAMPGNSIEEFPIPEGESFNSFQAYLCYKATCLFGDEYFTTRDRSSNCIQVYRGSAVNLLETNL